jgi:hypothetical protein
MITIDKIEIVKEPDTCSTGEELGKYTNTPGPDDRTIDRQARGDQKRSEYRYFVAAMSGAETGNPESVEQDYRRCESLNRGEWGYLSICARARVSYPDGLYSDKRTEYLSSGCLGGVESDCGDDCMRDIILEVLTGLRAHLAVFGVCLDNFDALAEAAMNR